MRRIGKSASIAALLAQPQAKPVKGKLALDAQALPILKNGIPLPIHVPVNAGFLDDRPAMSTYQENQQKLKRFSAHLKIKLSCLEEGFKIMILLLYQ